MNDDQQIDWWLAYRDALQALGSAAFFAGGRIGDFTNANVRLQDAIREIKKALAISAETSNDGGSNDQR